MSIDQINSLTNDELKEKLIECCHCEAWADRVLASAPYESEAGLIESCVYEWQAATEDEILEAFEGHPQIGDLEALRNKFAKTANSEQGQMIQADESVLLALGDRNREYAQRFGFIFIVCAKGKSAEEMLILLQERMGNSREVELVNGAREQGKIMQLRLAKWVEEV